MLKNTKLHLLGYLLLTANFAIAAQPDNEVQIQGEKDLAKTESNNDYIGDGCEVRPKDGCQARYLCHASGHIFGKNSASVNAAVRVANLRARGELAKHLKNQVKLQEELKSKEASYQKDGKDTQQIGELMETMLNSSADEVLQGVEIVMVKTNMEESSVFVQVGQKCSSVAAAQSRRNETERGQAGGGASNVQEPTIPANEVKSKSRTRDDF